MGRAFYLSAVAATALMTGAMGTIGACTNLDGLATNGTTIDTEGGTKPKEAGGGDSTLPDSGVKQRCDPTVAFGSPTLVTAFDPTADYVKGAILAPGELEVFYLKYNTPVSNWELRHARRSAVDAEWGTVVTIDLPTTPDGFLSLTASGLKLYYWTADTNFRTTRPSVTVDTFAAPTRYDVASGPRAHFVDADDVAYFAKPEGDGAFETFLKRAPVTTNGFSSKPTTVPKVHMAGSSDDNPVLNRAETALYFSSNRPGGFSTVVSDIWVARRPDKQADFGAPVHVPELSTANPDQVTWVSDDECVVFLDRASHVYTARRPAL